MPGYDNRKQAVYFDPNVEFNKNQINNNIVFALSKPFPQSVPVRNISDYTFKINDTTFELVANIYLITLK